MSTAPERESAKGLRTAGTVNLFDRLFRCLSDEEISRELRGHLDAERELALLAAEPSAKGRVIQGFNDSRRAAREALKRLGRLQNFRDDWSLTRDLLQPLLTVVRDLDPPPAPPSIPAWTGAPRPEQKALSETERAILMKTARNGKLDVETVTNATINDDDVLLQAIEEQNRQEKARTEAVTWACRKADEVCAVHASKVGEALWAEPITIEKHPDSDRRVILVRSATAPLFGTHGPTVKFDFRANGVPVNHKHPLMFKQLDGQKLIRSRVIQKKTHEFYVKGLDYKNGMIFKGYMEVNGEEDSGLTRFYQVRGETVARITVDEYREIENRLAAKLPPLPEPA